MNAGVEGLLYRGEQRLREIGLAAYLDFGAETGISRRHSREYVDSLNLEMRLINSGTSDSRCELFGKQLATPIMTGALSGLHKICREPMLELASGVSDAGSMIWVGIGPEEELERIIQIGAPVVKIVKPYRDGEKITAKLRHAEQAGATAVGMDISFFFGGKTRDTLIRSDTMLPRTKAEMRVFVETTRLPFVVKGVLSERDAVAAAEIGAACIVVSHHGGVVLDCAVPPLKILPTIVQAVGGQVKIIVDGGFRRGTDVLKALALGADGALMGRAIMAALAADGADGVTSFLKGCSEELRRAMSLCGCTSLSAVNSSILWRY